MSRVTGLVRCVFPCASSQTILQVPPFGCPVGWDVAISALLVKFGPNFFTGHCRDQVFCVPVPGQLAHVCSLGNLGRLTTSHCPVHHGTPGEIEMVPVQRFAFLGCLFNLLQGLEFPTKECWLKIQVWLQDFLAKEQHPTSDIH